MHLKTFLGAVLLTAFTMTAAQARDFRSADSRSPDSPSVLTVKKLGEIIGQKTGEQYAVKIYANGALGSENASLDLVKAGALDMASVSLSTLQDTVPEAAIPGLPFLFRNAKHFRAAMNGAAGEKILAACEKAGFVGLALLPSGPHSFFAKKPLKSLTAMKGLRLRVPPSEQAVAMAQALGAIPVATPASDDLAAALKAGTIDAAEGDIMTYESGKYYEAAPVFSETEHTAGVDVILFSKKVWNTLTRDEQKIIRDAVEDAVEFHDSLIAKQEDAAEARARKNGATFVNNVNHVEFAAAMKPVWDKFASTPELKALVQEIVATK